MKNYSYILLILFYGCVTTGKSHDPITKSDPFPIKKSAAVKTINIKNFIELGLDVDKIPSGHPLVIDLIKPVTLAEFFQFVSLQDVTIISNIGEKAAETISIPQFAGELKDLLKQVQMSHGLFFHYESGVLSVRNTSPVFVKVMIPETQSTLTELLKALGVENSYYDKFSSRIVFESDYYKYRKIADYFKTNDYLSLCNFDVVILERQDDKTFKSGVDWSALAVSISETLSNPVSLDVSGSADGAFKFTFGSENLTLQSVISSLNDFSNFDVLQSARISSVNGFPCTLDVSQKIPYVSEIKFTSLGDNSQVVQGYEFDKVSSGLLLSLLPSVVDNIININFNAQIQSVNEFLELITNGEKISQPVVNTRSVKNTVVLRPGQTALIGGLKYKKHGFKRSSLSWSDWGLTTKESDNFTLSILIRVQVVKYEFS